MTKSRTTPPRGIISWIRRRVLPMCAKACALLGLVILGLWITGRVLTDQYRWSQYLWWVPAIWVLGSAWVALVLSAIFALFARRLGGIFLRPVLLLACIGSTAYVFFGVWHMHRALFPTSVPSDAIRVVHWNQSSKKVDQAGFAQFVLDQEVDIVLVSNSTWGKEKQTLLDHLSPMAPDEKRRWVNYSFKGFVDPAHFRIEGDVFIASKYPLVRTGMVKINTPTKQESPVRPGSSHGWVLFAEFDLGEPGAPAEPFIVWLVDLPSNPLAWRQDIMQSVSQTINSWDGTSSIMGRHVWETIETNDAFPDPDLIIGDFNTLRGSASLDLLAPGMTDSFEAVGYGRGRSWMPSAQNKYFRQPFKLADWHIDLALVGSRWKPAGYQIKDTRQWGWTEHRMQIVDLIKTPE